MGQICRDGKEREEPPEITGMGGVGREELML